MDTSLLITVISALVAILFSIIGWLGKRIITAQDELLERIDTLKDAMQTRISRTELRLVKVETKVGIYK
jgi:hypothetical protein